MDRRSFLKGAIAVTITPSLPMDFVSAAIEGRLPVIFGVLQAREVGSDQWVTLTCHQVRSDGPTDVAVEASSDVYAEFRGFLRVRGGYNKRLAEKVMTGELSPGDSVTYRIPPVRACRGATSVFVGTDDDAIRHGVDPSTLVDLPLVPSPQVSL